MRPLALDFPTSDRPRFAPWMVFLGAFLIPLIYLPTLGTRFDFIDDGNLVYPSPQPGTVALNLYFNAQHQDSLTTASPAAQQWAVTSGYVFVRTEG